MLVDRSPGWDYVWVPDSTLALPFYDSTVSLAVCAAATSRARLGVACFASLGLRHPLVVAKQWANLDALSGGRMTMVACTGAYGPGRQREEAAFGVTGPQRLAFMEETVRFLRHASTVDRLSFVGQYLSVEDVALTPPFVQRPLPIWMAASPGPGAGPKTVSRVLRRVARLGDGWLTFAVTPKTLRAWRDELGTLAAAEGRDLSSNFPVCVYLNVNVDPDRQLALDDALTTWRQETARGITAAEVEELAALGPPARCAEKVAELADAGATAIVFGLLGRDKWAQLERLTEQVLPLIGRA